ncbi:hypothetical protein SCP_1403240 [Sparassis crispa]|uniref:Uncharacterized protein n=1 Tax=Sparassis crispa TaxID=139825 RepID=A0A401H3A3_9APHY|nr:hypothetical protein SCP_1403240 [Sparassis crispa]GBE88916.1 hypothetical protein SCP_1403240 [Sparassis crispa]
MLLPPPAPFDNDEEEAVPIDDDHVLAEVVLARTRERSYPGYLDELAAHLNQPQLPMLTRRFLYDQIHRHDPDAVSSNVVDLDDCPIVVSKISVFHSAVAIFYAPSDISGIHGMRRERIRSTPSWHGHPRRDCAFAVEDNSQPDFKGMSVAVQKSS